jgi:VCBS repeat-containing protein
VHKIAYSNSYDELSGSIQIDWTFSDGNSGYQGVGGPLSAINSTLICVTAVNDAPVVEATDVTGAVTEQVAPIGNLTDSGTIGFTDVDLADSHSISSVTASAGALGTLTPTITTDTTGSGLGGVVTWNYTVAASAVEYLVEGEHKVEAFTFSVLDGHGGSTERTVEVVITGTSDGNSAGVFDLAGAVTFWKSGAAIAGVTVIEDDVILWGRVSINKDLVVGKGAIILAHSGVDKTIEGGKTYFGAPVMEARKKWRELAALRMLPDLIMKIK